MLLPLVLTGSMHLPSEPSQHDCPITSSMKKKEGRKEETSNLWIIYVRHLPNIHIPRSMVLIL